MHKDTRFRGSNCRTLTDADLRYIIDSSGLSDCPKPPNKKTCYAIVKFNGRTYKVRKYLTPEDAQLRAELMSQSPDFFVRCVGVIGQYLVLEFVDGATPPLNTQTMSKIGEFLAKLGQVEVQQHPPIQFETWCGAISAAKVHSYTTLRLIRNYYETWLATRDIRWALEYFDAMPRNFVSRKGQDLIAVDEEHLRIGPKGISLVKPKSQLTQSEFEAIENAYKGKVDGGSPFEEFAEFYHLVFSLGFYAFRDRKLNSRVKEFHMRRRRLLCLIDAPLYLRIYEEIPWRARFYLQALSNNVRRVTRYLERMFAVQSKSPV